MKRIPISGGKHFALVSDADFERINAYKWYAMRGRYTTYAVLAGKAIYMHRMIMDTPKGKATDHINGNGLDNRRENLRVCTQRQNCQAKRSLRNNTTGHRGVTFDRGHYVARISVNGRRTHLGIFQTKEEAAAAYREAAHKYFGPFANTESA